MHDHYNDARTPLSPDLANWLRTSAGGKIRCANGPRGWPKPALMIINGVQPGKRNQIAIGVRVATPQEAQLYKVVVEAAELAK